MNSGRQRRTPFSIADILGPSMVPRAPSVPQLPEASPDPASPLFALEELTSKTFLGRAPRTLQLSEGRIAPEEPPGPGSGAGVRRRRKSRTAFTAQQVLELERRFVFQKYLAPSERDGLAAQLGLANAQVVTWFQNRRAKLKRDVEEMRADVASLCALSPGVLCHLALPDSASSPDPGPTGPDSEPRLSDEEIQVDD
ncbi:transcription factor LBX2 [Mesocricetus auratus]|uniref:Transcription factor LBX2 n=1 Tax=Mesocricetus auratus TaxID=10036 RepID=A0A1U7R2V6_MESAU|nr:transcription factor LBX2 [Mesocricetus auratus]